VISLSCARNRGAEQQGAPQRMNPTVLGNERTAEQQKKCDRHRGLRLGFSVAKPSMNARQQRAHNPSHTVDKGKRRRGRNNCAHKFACVNSRENELQQAPRHDVIDRGRREQKRPDLGIPLTASAQNSSQNR